MNKLPKPTPWFDGAKQSPYHVGWYECIPKEFFDGEGSYSSGRRHWNGWRISALVILGESDLEEQRCMEADGGWEIHELMWRGLTKEAK